MAVPFTGKNERTGAGGVAPKAVQDEEAPDEVLVAPVTIHAVDKGKSIGKGGKNIKVARLIAKRHHNLWDVQVV